MRSAIRFGALLALGVLILTVGRAGAGEGASQWCSDNTPIGAAQEIHLVDDPVTLNLEVGTAPQYFIVCYSTTPFGSTAPAVTGGHVFVDIENATVTCTPDASTTVIAVTCSIADPPAGRQGKSVLVQVRFQGTTASASAAGVRDTACVDDVTMATPAGPFGPSDIGVCAGP